MMHINETAGWLLREKLLNQLQIVEWHPVSGGVNWLDLKNQNAQTYFNGKKIKLYKKDSYVRTTMLRIDDDNLSCEMVIYLYSVVARASIVNVIELLALVVSG